MVVSRVRQNVLCFSSGVPFNAANGVKIRGQKKQRWLVSSLRGVDIVPSPSCSCPGRETGLPSLVPRPPTAAGTDVNAYSSMAYSWEKGFTLGPIPGLPSVHWRCTWERKSSP